MCSNFAYDFANFVSMVYLIVQNKVKFHYFMQMLPTNTTIGEQTLVSRGLDFNENSFWISLGALFGFTLFFNVGFTLALTYLKRKFVFLAYIVKSTQEICDIHVYMY